MSVSYQFSCDFQGCYEYIGSYDMEPEPETIAEFRAKAIQLGWRQVNRNAHFCPDHGNGITKTATSGLVCSSCGQPRSNGSASQCRVCYEKIY